MKKEKSLNLSFFIILIICGLLNMAFNIRDIEKQDDKPITLEEYNKKVNQKDKPVLVYFSADWCNVCGKFKPVIAKLETEYAGKIDLLKIDTERDTEISKEFEINTLPLLILYKNGKKEWLNAGVIELSVLRRDIECYL